MGSPVTLSGFNSINFSLVLNAIMQKERVPVTRLEAQKKVFEAQKSAFSTLASRLAALQSASDALTAPSALAGTSTVVSDPTRVMATGSPSAPPGTYEITVLELARAQVSVSAAVADAGATVATGGSLEIGGKTVTLSGPVTLHGLAAAINAATDIGVSANVVRGDQGHQLVLTGRTPGEGNGFVVDPAGLTEASLDFTQVQPASDARVSINNVVARSSTNTFDGAVPGVRFTVLKRDEAIAVTLTITASNDSVRALIEKLVGAFNQVVEFLDEQTTAANRGESDNVGRDPLARGLRREITSTLAAAYGSGLRDSLAVVGLGFDRTGRLEFDGTTFDGAMAADGTAVETLFRGADGKGGAFGALVSTIARYTNAGGLVPNAETRLTSQVSAVTKRIDDLEARLEIRRAALQREFIAADQAIAQLNAASGSLSSLGGQFRLF